MLEELLEKYLTTAIVKRFLAVERPNAALSDPLFVVSYQTRYRKTIERRMASHRLWKVLSDLGKAHGIPSLHPHALRHACAVELLKRTGNIAAVQKHLRHADIGTTTIYARMLPQDLHKKS